VNVLVQTEAGAFEVDLDSEDIEPVSAGAVEVCGSEPLTLNLPRVVATAASGSTIVAVVDRKPPLVVSHDAGATWRETGGGLPPGFAIALADDDPDLIVYASRNRLHVSTNGGVFWRALAVELPAIQSLAILS
jgi:hypothetical protein